MDQETLERISYLDQQLAALSELSDDQRALVDSHRHHQAQIIQEAMQAMGPRPMHGDATSFDQQQQQLEAELVLRSQLDASQTPGLDEWLHIQDERDRLTTMRNELVGQSQAAADSDAHLALPEPSLTHQLLQQHHHLQYDQQAQPSQPSVHEHGAIPLPVVSGAQWHVDANAVASWDPSAADGEQQHVEALGLDLNAPVFDVSAAYAAATATHHQHVQQPQSLHPVEVPLGSKQCRKCHLVKPYTEFYKSKANVDGYDGRCKACDAIQCVERRRKKQRVEAPTVTEKVCHKCKVNKASTEFYRNRTNRDGLYNNCKACFRANSAQRQQRLAPMDQRMADTKRCRRCDQEKPGSEFYKNQLMLDGLYSHCKACYQAAAAARNAGREPADAKTCRRCGVLKAASEFYKSKMTGDGLQAYCKHCYKITAARSRNKKLAGAASPKGDSDGLEDADEDGPHFQQPDSAAAELSSSGAEEALPQQAPLPHMAASSSLQQQQEAHMLSQHSQLPPPQHLQHLLLQQQAQLLPLQQHLLLASAPLAMPPPQHPPPVAMSSVGGQLAQSQARLHGMLEPSSLPPQHLAPAMM